MHGIENLPWVNAGALELMWDDENAKRGDVEAQYNVGMRFYVGFGEVENKKEAAKWFTLAAEKGHRKAREYLEKIKKELSDD